MKNTIEDLNIEIAYYISLSALTNDEVTRNAIQDIIAELQAEKATFQPSRQAA